MKRLLFFIVTAVVLSSCNIVYFDAPQPAGSEPVDSFPSEWQGAYISDSDTTVIGANYIVVPVWGKKSRFMLSDSLVLKPYKDGFFVLNIIPTKDTAGVWIPVLMKKSGRKLYVYTVDYNDNLQKKLDEAGIKYERTKTKDIIIEQLTREQFDVLIKKKFFVRSGLLKKVE